MLERSRGASGRWRGCLLVIILVLAVCFLLSLRLELLINDYRVGFVALGGVVVLVVVVVVGHIVASVFYDVGTPRGFLDDEVD